MGFNLRRPFEVQPQDEKQKFQEAENLKGFGVSFANVAVKDPAAARLADREDGVKLRSHIAEKCGFVPVSFFHRKGLEAFEEADAMRTAFFLGLSFGQNLSRLSTTVLFGTAP